MTAALPDPSQRMFWFAHQNHKLTSVAAIVFLCGFFHMPYWLVVVMSSVFSVLLLAIFVIACFEHNHDSSQCIHCFKNFPVYGAFEAMGKINIIWFFIYHLVYWRVFIFVQFTSLFVVGIFILGTKNWLLWLCSVGVTLVVIALAAWAKKVHMRLKAWCPACRNGGGGWNKVIPEPVPGPEMTKSR